MKSRIPHNGWSAAAEPAVHGQPAETEATATARHARHERARFGSHDAGGRTMIANGVAINRVDGHRAMRRFAADSPAMNSPESSAGPYVADGSATMSATAATATGFANRDGAAAILSDSGSEGPLNRNLNGAHASLQRLKTAPRRRALIQANPVAEPDQWVWVASREDTVVGVVALSHEAPHVARVRRIRVARNCPESWVCQSLVAAAVRHCRDAGYLKVVFEGEHDLEWLKAMLHECGVEYARQRAVAGRTRSEFYINIYHHQQQCDENPADDWVAGMR